MRSVANMTDFEQSTLEALISDGSGNIRRTELLICIDERGTAEIDRAEGEESRVDLTEEMERRLIAGGTVKLFHNHPSNNSISGSDWHQSIRWDGRAEIVVLNRYGSVFCGTSEKSADVKRLLTQVQLNDVRDDGESALLSSGGPELAKLKISSVHLVSHIINLRLRNMGLVCYDTWLSEYDEGLLQACADSSLLIAIDTAITGLLNNVK